MKPYRVPGARATLPDASQAPDYGRLEQLAIYVVIAIAVVLLALAEIKIS